jgi:hypothetical protein
MVAFRLFAFSGGEHGAVPSSRPPTRATLAEAIAAFYKHLDVVEAGEIDASTLTGGYK